MALSLAIPDNPVRRKCWRDWMLTEATTMRYIINGRLIYDATDGALTLPGSDEPDRQLSITASALLWFFLRNTGVVCRDEVLKKSGMITD